MHHCVINNNICFLLMLPCIFVTMFKKILLIFLPILCCLVIGCKENSNTELKEAPPSSTIDRQTLPGIEWLNTTANYSNEKYADSFFLYYKNATQNKLVEQSATYLMSYGAALAKRLTYDSTYYNIATQFLSLHEKEISTEALGFLCYYLGFQKFLENDFNVCKSWYHKGLALKAETREQLQNQGFTHFSLAQLLLHTHENELAEQNLIAALQVFEVVKDTLNQATVNMLLHSLYARINAVDASEKALAKALHIAKEKQNKYLILNAYIFYVHYHVGNSDTLNAVKYIVLLSLLKRNTQK